MLARISTFGAMVTLWPLSYGFVVSDDFLMSKRANEMLSSIDDWHVLNAFQAINHPDSVPLQTWEDEDGITYQELRSFNADEWNAMYNTLLEDAIGMNSSELLHPRQQEDPPIFFCTGEKIDPFAYVETLKSVTGIICGFFTYGAGELGKLQIINRYDLKDVGGKPVKTIFKYGWMALSFASATSCSTAIEYGINHTCNPIDSKTGKRVTKGETTQYGNPKNDKILATAGVSVKHKN